MSKPTPYTTFKSSFNRLFKQVSEQDSELLILRSGQKEKNLRSVTASLRPIQDQEDTNRYTSYIYDTMPKMTSALDEMFNEIAANPQKKFVITKDEISLVLEQFVPKF